MLGCGDGIVLGSNDGEPLGSLHLELQIETQYGLLEEMIWVIQMAHLMVLMKENLWVCYLVKHLDNMIEPYWDLHIVLKTQLNMVCLMEKHWSYHKAILLN